MDSKESKPGNNGGKDNDNSSVNQKISEKKPPTLQEKITKAQLKVDDELTLPEPLITITREGSLSSVATFGNFSLWVGRPKSRKTFFASYLAGIATAGHAVDSVFSVNSSNKFVLFFDTEQGKPHAIKVLKRIRQIASGQLDNLRYYCLRPFAKQDRITIIDHLIKTTPNIGLVVIDGVKDLVKSINDESEATEVTQLLMTWSEVWNIHIAAFLHLNKINEDARGHLGTELVNKAESVIEVRKSADRPELSEIWPKFMRDMDFKPIAFGINEEDVPEIECDFKPIERKQAPKPEDIPDNDLKKILKNAFEGADNVPYAMLVNRIKRAAKSFGFDFGDNKIKALIKACKEKEFIIKQPKYHGYQLP